MTTAKKESLRLQLDRSAALRSNIKRYYIYVVLLLIVLVFSVVKLDKVSFSGFSVGGTSSARIASSTCCAARSPSSDFERRFHPADDLRLH